eukprot:SAG31_NODE_6838_length_1874_cov_1.015775_1_plen_35_part_10
MSMDAENDDDTSQGRATLLVWGSHRSDYNEWRSSE